MPASWKPTAADLVDALREHYLPSDALRSGREEWSLLTEVPSLGAPDAGASAAPMPTWDPTGDRAAYSKALTEWRDWQKTVRNIDVLLMHNWPSGKVPHERIAIETKISRGDFLRDTAAKRAPWEALSHRFAYCVPRGLVRPEEIPSGCWLIEVDEHPCSSTTGAAHARHTPTRIHWSPKVKGARRSSPLMPQELASHLARRASRAEETLRTAGGSAAAARTEEALRKALERVRVLEQREYVNRRRVTAALGLIAPLGRQVCADCGEPIRPVVDSRYGSGRWTHRTVVLDNTCAIAGRRYSSVEPASVRAAREWELDDERQSRSEADAWRDVLRDQ